VLVSLLKNLFGGGTPTDDLLSGVAAYHRGDLDAADRLLAKAIRQAPRSAEAHLYAGLAARKAGRDRDALPLLRRASELDPDNAAGRYQLAETEYRLGDHEAAWRACEQALERAPDFEQCHRLMARIALPGPSYLDILSFLHRTLRPRTYLEIGVATGESFALALPGTRAIGVDPEPRLEYPLPAGSTVARMTSDRFFSTDDVKSEFGGRPVDMAFIDGLHRFEHALRDFINVERHCGRGSTVLIHDCYPLNRLTARRERATRFWSGDIWRLVLALRKYRPDLSVHTIAAPPTGLAIVRGLDPDSNALRGRAGDIVEEFLAVDYGVLDADKPGLLNRFPNDPGKLEALLR
jgi:predicted O-methyltransferase YrrM